MNMYIYIYIKRRHPTHPVPELLDVGCPLVVNEASVLAALKAFPRGTSPGFSGLRAQHLLDGITGTTSPSAQVCLTELAV